MWEVFVRDGCLGYDRHVKGILGVSKNRCIAFKLAVAYDLKSHTETADCPTKPAPQQYAPHCSNHCILCSQIYSNLGIKSTSAVLEVNRYGIWTYNVFRALTLSAYCLTVALPGDISVVNDHSLPLPMIHGVHSHTVRNHILIDCRQATSGSSTCLQGRSLAFPRMFILMKRKSLKPVQITGILRQWWHSRRIVSKWKSQWHQFPSFKDSGITLCFKTEETAECRWGNVRSWWLWSVQVSTVLVVDS